MSLPIFYSSQGLQSLTLSIEVLSSACIDKEYSDQQRAYLCRAFADSYQQLLIGFKRYLNLHGFVVCSSKSILQAAFKEKFILSEEYETLLKAIDFSKVLAGSYDDEMVLSLELLIEAEYAPTVIDITKRMGVQTS
ncbi:hypothetical protein [Psychromonas hadalis]|uniref:hypothetical protein n=1 Tax=Psychromonas hadalis TaxID=211669 RepID=UPI0003B4E2B1|nr:hypothetical protein [Psychromonas hadalis]